MQRQIEGWWNRYEKAKTDDVPTAQELYEWLVDNTPATSDAALVHNDWKLDNIAIDPDDPSHVTAVYDWDMCTLGDPLSDVGGMLALWFQDGESIGGGNFIMPTTVPGFLNRKEAAERYAERSGRSIEDISFYFAFGQFRMAVILQQIYYRFHVGQTKDKRFRSFGMLAQFLLALGKSNAVKPGL